MRRRELSTVKLASSATVDSLQRGLDVLRCFHPGDEILSATEIARRLTIPVQTALRIMDTLEDAGFLRHFAGTDNFSLHDECQFLGQAFLSSSTLVRKARPILQTFADRFDVHALVCVPDHLSMMVLLCISSDSLQPLQLGPGFLLPIGSSAFGHAWLWRQDGALQDEWLLRLCKEELASSGNSHITQIRKSFYDLEESGICITASDSRDGFSMMATPLVLENEATAALGCLEVSSRWTEVSSRAEIGVALRETADSIHNVLRSARF